MDENRFEGRWQQPPLRGALDRVVLQGDRWVDEAWRSQQSGFTPPEWTEEAFSEWDDEDESTKKESRLSLEDINWVMLTL